MLSTGESAESIGLGVSSRYWNNHGQREISSNYFKHPTSNFSCG